MYIGHREGKNIRPRKSWLRVHRTCVGAGGSLSLVVREVQNGVSEVIVLVRSTEVSESAHCSMRGGLLHSSFCGKKF